MLVNLGKNILELLSKVFFALSVIFKHWLLSFIELKIMPYSSILELSSLIIEQLDCAFYSTYFTFQYNEIMPY